MGLKVILPYFLICYLYFYCKWVEGYRKLSKEDDLELDEQPKRVNKSALKTIKTKYGDIYDCVDFYKQPSFDHPLLKNHNFHPEMQSTSFPRDSEQVTIGLDGGGCPIGMVPIRRTTKDDLIRAKLLSEMHASKITPLDNDNKPNTHYAVALTDNDKNYDGIGGVLNVWNIPVQASQYTAGRIKLSHGAESIEAGWMVNPALYGNNDTHLYIFTNAGASHCFDAKCGFVQVNKQVPVGGTFQPVSVYGGLQEIANLSIVRDMNKWILKFGETPLDIGYWPVELFTNLGKTATQAEWGGEVFTPPDVPAPGMGSGHFLKFDTSYDGFCSEVHIRENNNVMNPPNTLNIISDDKYHYNLKNEGKVSGGAGYLIFYGGPGGVSGGT